MNKYSMAPVCPDAQAQLTCPRKPTAFPEWPV
uniref:Rhbdd1 protein n=1 Tax=Mus musculus TaxID=10090 RepID=Q99KD9_MOUSE|nr:Rhbdd1 protein [Mus musculus]